MPHQFNLTRNAQIFAQAGGAEASEALIVLDEVMLIAGYANLSVRAWSSILQYVA